MLFAPRGAAKLATEGVLMFRKLIATDNDSATTILRLVLGVISSPTAPRRCSDGSVVMASPARWDSSRERCTSQPHSHFWPLPRNSSVDWVLSLDCSPALRPLESLAT